MDEPFVTILPQQASKISMLAEVIGTAIKITQEGSVLELNFGRPYTKIYIDAQGKEIKYTRKRQRA